MSLRVAAPLRGWCLEETRISVLGGDATRRGLFVVTP
jgi:hypothetical protein